MSTPESLNPPGTNIEDPGAHELESDPEEHFSDAHSSMVTPAPPSPTPSSPIPRTRIEKVSDQPSYGEVPGTEAYSKRTGDAAPDEIAVIPDANKTDGTPVESEDEAKGVVGRSGNVPLPGGQPIPLTVVEEAAGSSGPHSEEFMDKRRADAPPDMIVKPKAEEASPIDSDEQSDQDQGQDPDVTMPELTGGVSSTEREALSGSPAPSLSPFLAPGGFPTTESDDEDDEVPVATSTGFEVKSTTDALPEEGHSPHADDVNPAQNDAEAAPDSRGRTSFNAEETLPVVSDGSHGDDGFEDEFGDDFDDFEAGDGAGAFDDFDDHGFQQPEHDSMHASTILPIPIRPPADKPQAPPQPVSSIQIPFTIPDFDGMEADELYSLVDPCLAHLFPPEQLATAPVPPSHGDNLNEDPLIFLTQRSASLWSQLVAPPPLAPPDWIRSRIRRAFLVSLGVPVDLDEILPASKQKKLILPSLAVSSETWAKPSSTSGTTTTASEAAAAAAAGGGGEETKGDDAGQRYPSFNNNNNFRGTNRTSLDTKGPSGPRRGVPAMPNFDLFAARQLCSATVEALDGMDDDELREHVARLEAMQTAAQEALEYWQKRTDAQIGDREAFEGVIENLVKHARKVRK